MHRHNGTTMRTRLITGVARGERYTIRVRRPGRTTERRRAIAEGLA